MRSERIAKSLAAEDTFEHDLITMEEMYTELAKLSDKVSARLSKHNLKGRTLTLKVKYSDFKQITRNYSSSYPFREYELILETAKDLLDHVDLADKKVRLLGISISNFGELALPVTRSSNPYQLELFAR